MPTLLIRDVPEDVMRGLSIHAVAAGLNREAWVRDQLKVMAMQSAVRNAYSLR